MTKSLSPIIAEGREILEKVEKSWHERTLYDEESKLNPPVVSGHSTFKAERGLIREQLPPSATHTKNT